MARLIKPYLFLLFLLFSPGVQAQDSLKVVSYNLMGMKPGTYPDTRLPQIIEKLIALDPDIIGLQEINQDRYGSGLDNQCRVIADSLSSYFGTPYYYYQEFTHHSWDNQYNEYIGIITKLSVLETGYYQLATGVFPRKVVWNLIETPFGKINFLNTHLSYNSSATRIQQVQQIIDYINSLHQSYETYGTILCGDFNDTPGSSAIKKLTETGSSDFYFDTYRENNPGESGNTVPSNAPTSRIDYIFQHSKSYLDIDSSYIVMDTPFNGNTYCSDHLGVATVFREGTPVHIKTPMELQHSIFTLNPAWPNPFSSETQIEFELFSAAKVKLSIHDITGRELFVLTNGFKPAGKHQFVFSPPDMEAEFLICKLQVDAYASFVKLVKE